MSELFKEFPEHNRAVVLNAEGMILWQLEKPVLNAKKWWKTSGAILTFSTKKECKAMAKQMGFPMNHVERVTVPLGFTAYAIRYDFRYDYYMAFWEI